MTVSSNANHHDLSHIFQLTKIYADLLPTPKHQRNWRAWNYILFYCSLAMDNWTMGSSLIGVGLKWWHAIIAIFVAEFISGIASALNSRCAEVYHIGFPVVARSVFGMYGSFYAVAARAVLAVIYYSLKIYVGSSFVVNMLQAVFGQHFTSIPNHLPESLNFTTQQMLAFVLFWLCHVPLVFLRPYQLKWLFTLKMLTTLPAMIGLFIFCMVNTGAKFGGNVIKSGTPINSSAWLFLYAMNSALGAHSTVITNQPDFSRWSKNRRSSIWPQLIFWPLGVTISATFGILATAAINQAWDKTLWNQWDLLTAILERYPRPDVRFAVFVCALFWAILVIGTNVASNMVPLGSDMALLFPRYMTMTRGQVLGLFLSWAVCPWNIYASATVFTKFLSGYGLFMAGLSGTMIVDYALTKGNVFLGSLYNASSHNPHYYYQFGCNVKAYIAYLGGVAFGFAGFLGNLGVKVPIKARELGYLGWLLSFTVAPFIYVCLCAIWPTGCQRIVRENRLGWEAVALPNDQDFELAAEDSVSAGPDDVIAVNIEDDKKV